MQVFPSNLASVHNVIDKTVHYDLVSEEFWLAIEDVSGPHISASTTWGGEETEPFGDGDVGADSGMHGIEDGDDAT